jgi:hypothetical protein
MYRALERPLEIKLQTSSELTCSGSKIPLIIHRTYSRKDWRAHYIGAHEATARSNPNFIQIVYDHEDRLSFFVKWFGKTHRVTRAYTAINPVYGAARADIFRYAVVYILGGVYLDIKTAAVRCLEDEIRSTDRMICSHWRDDTRRMVEGVVELQQYYICAEPNHPVLWCALEMVVENVEKTVRAVSDQTALPLFLNVNGSNISSQIFAMTGGLAFTSAVKRASSTGPFLATTRDSVPFHGIFTSPESLVDTSHVRISSPDLGGTLIWGYINHYKVEGFRHYSMLSEPLVVLECMEGLDSPGEKK